MLKNKVFAIIIALALSLVVFYNMKFFSQKGKKSNSPPSSVEEIPDIIEAPAGQKERSPTEEKELLSPFWGRNPFLLPGEEKLGRSFFLTSSPAEEETKTGSAVEKKQEEGEWSLTAIIYNGTTSRAIINHEIVQEGDTISGGKVQVIKIMPEKVILSREEKFFTLPLGAIIPRERKTDEEQEKSGKVR